MLWEVVPIFNKCIGTGILLRSGDLRLFLNVFLFFLTKWCNFSFSNSKQPNEHSYTQLNPEITSTCGSSFCGVELRELWTKRCILRHNYLQSQCNRPWVNGNVIVTWRYGIWNEKWLNLFLRWAQPSRVIPIPIWSHLCGASQPRIQNGCLTANSGRFPAWLPVRFELHSCPSTPLSYSYDHYSHYLERPITEHNTNVSRSPSILTIRR